MKTAIFNDWQAAGIGAILGVCATLLLFAIGAIVYDEGYLKGQAECACEQRQEGD